MFKFLFNLTTGLAKGVVWYFIICVVLIVGLSIISIPIMLLTR
jgi:hypothetical protein